MRLQENMTELLSEIHKEPWEIHIYLPSAPNTFWVADKRINWLPVVSLSTIFEKQKLWKPNQVSSKIEDILKWWWKIFIPMMNSRWGHVASSMDDILSFPKLSDIAIEYVTEEKIDHILCSTWDESSITTIYSHPQAIAQCFDSIWHLDTIPTGSTWAFIWKDWIEADISSPDFDISSLPSNAWLLLPQSKVDEIKWLNDHKNVSPEWNKTTFCVIWNKQEYHKEIIPDNETSWFYYVDVWWTSWELLFILFELYWAWIDLDYISSIDLWGWKYRIWFSTKDSLLNSNIQSDPKKLSEILSNKINWLEKSLWASEMKISKTPSDSINFSIENNKWALLTILLYIYYESISLDSIHSKVWSDWAVSFEVISSSSKFSSLVSKKIWAKDFIESIERDIANDIMNISSWFTPPEIKKVPYVSSVFNDSDIALSSFDDYFSDINKWIVESLNNPSEESNWDLWNLHNWFIYYISSISWESNLSENNELLWCFEELKTLLESRENEINLDSFYSFIRKRFSFNNKLWQIKSHFNLESFYNENEKQKLLSFSSWNDFVSEVLSFLYSISYITQEIWFKRED